MRVIYFRSKILVETDSANRFLRKLTCTESSEKQSAAKKGRVQSRILKNEEEEKNHENKSINNKFKNTEKKKKRIGTD